VWIPDDADQDSEMIGDQDSELMPIKEWTGIGINYTGQKAW
jgi:hypothetical protein